MKKPALSLAPPQEEQFAENPNHRYAECDLVDMGDKALALIAKQGISEETIARLGWRNVHGYPHIIAIPYHRKGKTLNWLYREVLGADRVLWSYDLANQIFYNLEALESIEKMPADSQIATEIIITDDELDCALALENGYLAICLPRHLSNPAPDTPPEAELDFLKDFPKISIAVLALSDWEENRALRQRIALKLGWARCKWVQYPKECRQLRQVHAKFGSKGLDVVLKEKSKFLNSGGLRTMSEIPSQLGITAHPLPIEGMEDMVKLRLGDMLLITGHAGIGKSLFTKAIAAGMANTYGWNICIGDFEGSPRGEMQDYLRKFFIGRPEKETVFTSGWEERDRAAADEWINRKFSFIVPDVTGPEPINLEWVLEHCKAAITQHRANMIIIDPWNEIDHDRPRGMSLTEYTGYAIKQFKRLAKNYMVMIVIVTHPAKMEKNKDGDYDMPTLFDIADSAHWRNKCDLGLVVGRLKGRDGNYAAVVRISKVRHWGIIGMTGERLLEFDKNTGRYIYSPGFVTEEEEKQKEKKRKAKEEKDASKKEKIPEEPIGFFKGKT